MTSFAGAIVFGRDGRDMPCAPPAACDPGLVDGGSAIAQPAWGGRGWVALSGRLDDRRTLADALGLRAGEARSDLSLACGAVERWGAHAPDRLLGDFALAAWHGGERRLILAGDPMGMRTVYYWRGADRILFSCSLRGLMAMPEVPRAVNDVAVADYLAMNFGDSDATFYRDVFKVPAGTCVVLSADGVSSRAFHRFDPERRIRLGRDEDYVDRARELLDRAVADRMRGARTAIVGSGGLDSACLAVAALRHAPTVPFLTAVPEPGLALAPCSDHHYPDETPFVEALAAAFPGLQLECVSPPAHAPWSPDNWGLIAAGAAPYRAPAHLAWTDEPARRAAALGATTYLTGAVGNVTLTWDGMKRMPTLFRQGRWLRLARELALTSRGRPRRLAGLVRDHLYHPLRGPRFRQSALGAFCALSRSALDDMRMMDRLRQRGSDPEFVWSGDSRHWRLAVICRARGHRSEVMNTLRGYQGISSSAPLADLRLVEFCLAIPEDQFQRDGTTRWLARRLLRAAGVPAAIAENRRRGLQHPEWFAHLERIRPSLPAQLERLRRSPTASRLIDMDRLDRVLADWPADARAAGPRRAQMETLLQGALSAGAFIAWVEGTN